MMLPAQARDPVAAPDHERDALVTLDRLLDAQRENSLTLIGLGGDEVELPETVVQVLKQVVRAMAQERAVTVVPVDKQLTTQQAANLLNVSRPYLVRLLDTGKIPYTKAGTHRRIQFDDVIAYRERRGAARKLTLDRLTRSGQESEHYFDG